MTTSSRPIAAAIRPALSCAEPTEGEIELTFWAWNDSGSVAVLQHVGQAGGLVLGEPGAAAAVDLAAAAGDHAG